MTICRDALEKRMAQVRQDNRRKACKVADRLMGIQRFKLLRESGSEWKMVRKFTSRVEANEYANTHGGRLWQVEEDCG